MKPPGYDAGQTKVGCRGLLSSSCSHGVRAWVQILGTCTPSSTEAARTHRGSHRLYARHAASSVPHRASAA